MLPEYVLLIGHDDAILSSLKAVLRTTGLQSLVAKSVKEALEYCRTYAPHLVIAHENERGGEIDIFLQRINLIPSLYGAPAFVLASEKGRKGWEKKTPESVKDVLTLPLAVKDIVPKVKKALKERPIARFRFPELDADARLSTKCRFSIDHINEAGFFLLGQVRLKESLRVAARNPVLKRIGFEDCIHLVRHSRFEGDHYHNAILAIGIGREQAAGISKHLQKVGDMGEFPIPEESPRILIVDDDPEFGKLLGHLLKKFGMDPHVTETPHEFLQGLKSKKFDLCFVDMNMGYEGADRQQMGALVIQAVRKVIGPELPVVVVSLSQSRESIESALAAGANDYVTKPLDRKVLAAKIHRFVGTSAMREWINKYEDPKPEESEVLLELELTISEVNESGIIASSPHLFKKGSRISLQGPTLTQVTGLTSGTPFTVLEVEQDPKTRLFRHTLEFDSGWTEIIRAVRVWILRRTSDTA